MIEKDTIKGLECCTDEWYENCNECPYSIDTVSCERMKLLEDSLDLINHKQELLEAAIAGQETLQKALAEKNAEIERRKNNLFCKVVIDEGKMRNIVNEKVAEFELDIESIKSEAIKECIEKTQAFLAIKCRGVVEDNPNLDEILWGYRKEDVDEFLDNLVKEMAGDTE